MFGFQFTLYHITPIYLIPIKITLYNYNRFSVKYYQIVFPFKVILYVESFNLFELIFFKIFLTNTPPLVIDQAPYIFYIAPLDKYRLSDNSIFHTNIFY